MSLWTYILASGRNGTLYVGSTDDIGKRVHQHRTKVFGGFTAKYGVTTLVWCEQHETRETAFRRERQIKKWNRAWKIELIERFNPGWRDLTDEITGCTSDVEGQTAWFLDAIRPRMEEADEKSLGPRFRGDEQSVGEGDAPLDPHSLEIGIIENTE